MRGELLFVRPGEKVCATCGDAKPHDAFHRDARRSDGVTGSCSDCRNARKRARYAKNPEPFKEQNRASYAKHADVRRVYARKRHATHRNEINTKAREMYATDEAYRQRHLDATRRSVARRKRAASLR